MLAEGRLEQAVCVGIVSDEGPAEIREEADLALAGPDAVDRDPSATSES